MNAEICGIIVFFGLLCSKNWFALFGWICQTAAKIRYYKYIYINMKCKFLPSTPGSLARTRDAIRFTIHLGHKQILSDAGSLRWSYQRSLGWTGLDLQCRQLSQSNDPFHNGLRYCGKTWEFTSIYNHTSTKIDAIYIYISITFPDAHMYIFGLSCYYIHLYYTHVFIFLNFPHFWWLGKRHRGTCIEQDGIQN